MARYSRTFRHIGAAKRAAYRDRQRPQTGAQLVDTTMTVETLLTTLDALAVQADQATTTQQRGGATWEGETLQALARQVRCLVHAADHQINP